jgi:hypothetical protein
MGGAVNIIVYREGKPALEAHERVDRKLLASIIEAERLEVIFLDSPVEHRAIGLFFDEEGASKHRGQNILLPNGSDIRGHAVLVGIDEYDKETGLLPEELSAYELRVTDRHFLQELTPAFEIE